MQDRQPTQAEAALSCEFVRAFNCDHAERAGCGAERFLAVPAGHGEKCRRSRIGVSNPGLAVKRGAARGFAGTAADAVVEVEDYSLRHNFAISGGTIGNPPVSSKVTSNSARAETSLVSTRAQA